MTPRFAADCLLALAGRVDDESSEADRALVGALLVAEFMADVRMLRQAYVKTG